MNYFRIRNSQNSYDFNVLRPQITKAGTNIELFGPRLSNIGAPNQRISTSFLKQKSINCTTDKNILEAQNKYKNKNILNGRPMNASAEIDAVLIAHSSNYEIWQLSNEERANILDNMVNVQKIISADELKELGIKEDPNTLINKIAYQRISPDESANILRKISNYLIDRANHSEENSTIINNTNTHILDATQKGKAEKTKTGYLLVKYGASIDSNFKLGEKSYVVTEDKDGNQVRYTPNGIKITTKDGKTYYYMGNNKPKDYDFTEIKVAVLVAQDNATLCEEN